MFSTNWICTDPDTEQYGKQLDELIFEFKEKNKPQMVINLDEFEEHEIEDIINSYGYTLYDVSSEQENNYNNIYTLYGDSANWVTAECIYEYESNFYENE